MQRRVIIAGGVAAALVVVGLWTGLRATRTPSVVAEPPVQTTTQPHLPPAPMAWPRCTWTDGQTFAFAVSQQTKVTLHPDALTPTPQRAQAHSGQAETTEQAHGSGTLVAQVLTVSATGEAVVAARLSAWTSDAAQPDPEPSIARDMQRPYLVRLNARCQVLATARHKDASVIAYARVLGVLDRLDVGLPVPASSPATTATYTTDHVDASGEFRVENHFAPAAAPDRGSLTRTRLAYGRSATPGLRLRIRHAAGHVDLGAGPWLARIDDEEDTDALVGGQVAVRSQGESHVQQQAAPESPFAGAALDPAGFVWGRPTQQDVAAAHDALRGLDLAGLSESDAWAKFVALRDSRQPGAWQDAQRLLRDWIRQNPQALPGLAKHLLAGKYRVAEQADLMLALAKSGSSQARQLLADLARNAAASSDLRVQAASACADLDAPTHDTVAAMRELSAQPRTGEPSDILGSTATMTLGTLVDTVPGSAVAVEASQALHDMLQSDEPVRHVEALYAMSNSGDPAFAADVLHAAQSADVAERAAAAHAMRKMLPTADVAAAMDKLMDEETDQEVVKQLAESRRQQLQLYGGQLTSQELSLYATKLPSAPEGVRWELLRTLGEASRLQADARTILVNWYPHEQVKALRVLMGQYLPANVLQP